MNEAETKSPVYLDYNATTPVAPEVVAAMQPFLEARFGNPSSSHSYGKAARSAVEQARDDVAMLIGAFPEEIVFTGSATEANNLALIGSAFAHRHARRHILISAVEHAAVVAPATWLQSLGWRVSVVPVDSHGRVDPDDVARVICQDTLIVSVMHANNEVGTIQPIAEIASIAHKHGAMMHTDAAQSPGKLPINVDALGADLVALAGHKFYAMKGVGVLYLRNGRHLEPHLYGAGHERGLRSGTENVPGIVGLGAAARLAAADVISNAMRLRRLRDQMHEMLVNAIPELKLNGHPQHRLPNTLNLSFPRISGGQLLAAVDLDVAASVGSACHSTQDPVSGVLSAMGIDSSREMGAVKTSLGRYTTNDDINRAAAGLVIGWERLVSAPRTRSELIK